MSKRPSANAVVNVLLSVACVVIIGDRVRDWLRPVTASASAVTPIPMGTRVVLTNDVILRDRNIVLFARSNCRFCSESMAFYRRLSAEVRPRNVQFVVAGGEPEAVLSQYLASHQLAVDRVVSMATPPEGVRVTPTLAVLDKNGAVVQSWVGKLPTEDEKAVERLLMQ